MAAKPKPPIWMPLKTAETAAETARLSAAAFGALMRLRFDYWTSGPPADDDELLARITGTSLPEWRRLRPAIEHFFCVGEGWWISPAIDAELELAYGKINEQRRRTAAATKARWSSGIRNADRNGIRNADRNGIRNGVPITSKPYTAPSQGEPGCSPCADGSVGSASGGREAEVGDDF